jgi:anti-sigma factor RsiW
MDGELPTRQGLDIEAHLGNCSACREEKSRLEWLETSLEKTLKAEGAAVSFASLRAETYRRILEHRPSRHRIAERLAPVRFPRPAAWALSAAAVIVMVLVGPALLERISGPRNGNGAAVDSIESYGSNVVLFREARTKTTVIWLFESPGENGDQEELEGETPSDGPAS